MRKKFIGAFLLGLLALGTAGTITSCKDYDGDISALKNEINTLKSSVDSKEATINQLITDLQTAQTKCASSCQAAREALSNQLSGVDNEIKADIVAKYAALTATDQALQDAIDALKIAVAQNTTDIASLVQKDAELDAAIKEANVQIGVAKDMATKAQEAADKAQATADTNTAAIKELNEVTIPALATRVSDIETQLVTTTKTANDALALAQANSDLIENLQAYDEILLGKCDSLGVEINNLKDEVALKASKEYVDAELAKKVNTVDFEAYKTAVADELADMKAECAANLTAAKSYTDQEIAKVNETLKNYYTKDETDAKLDEVTAAYKAADEALQAEIDALQNQVDSQYAELVARIATEEARLKSLVFNPEEYYLGIESIGLMSYTYNAYTFDEANDTLDQVLKDGYVDAKMGETTTTNTNGQFTAQYYLNPSNANVSLDKADYAWLSNDATYYVYSRSGNTDFTVDSVAKAEKGKINVYSHVSADKIKNISLTQDKLTVIALQYTDKTEDNDTIITSDFAALRKYTVSGFIINKVSDPSLIKDEEKHAAAPANHLYCTAYEAATENGGAPMLSVPYDSQIDLDSYINVHATVNGNADQVWGDQAYLKQHDFKLVYELIGYTSGEGYKNSTFGAIIGNKYFKPTGEINAVGMNPMLRVRLVDTKNDATVAVGYTMIQITATANTLSLEKTATYTLSCDADLADANGVIELNYFTDQDVEDNLMSAAEFSKYQLVKEDWGVARQYRLDENGNYVTTYDNVTGINVYPTTTDGNKLFLRMSNAGAYMVFKNSDTASTIVRYDKYVGGKVANSIYVTLIVKANKVQNPTVAFNDEEDKVRTTWYARNSKEVGFDELHAHVNDGTGSISTFQISVAKPNWQMDNDIVDPAEIAKKKLSDQSLNTDLTIKYTFVTPRITEVPSANYNKDGKYSDDRYYYYTLSVNEAGTELIATDPYGLYQTIATIDVNTGMVTYCNNDFSKDILNAYDHDALGDHQTLTARVKMVADLCAPLDDINIENGEFDVKFLRPITINPGNMTVIDSKPSTYTQTLTYSYVDWRDYTPSQFATNVPGKDFINFYEIQSVAIDATHNITSTFLGGDDYVYVKSLSDYIDFSLVDATDHKTGELTYIRKQDLGQHEFSVKVPVVVTYAWGKIYTDITVKIEPTDKNADAAKRK